MITFPFITLTYILLGNRGIGLALAILLADKFPESKIVITTRFDKDGESALSEANRSNISYTILDITSDDSVNSFIDFVKSQGGVKVFVNNAAVVGGGHIKVPSGEDTVVVNFFRTVHLIKHVFPLVSSEDGRIINVSSVFGVIDPKYGKDIRDILLDDNVKEESLFELGKRYIELEKIGRAHV